MSTDNHLKRLLALEVELRQVKGAYGFLYSMLIGSDDHPSAVSLDKTYADDFLGLAESVENGLDRLDRIIHPERLSDQ
jgi:hypothetical protein